MNYNALQNGVPITLYNGQPGIDSLTLDLNPSYDHVITCIVAQNSYGGVDDYLEIDDQDGNYLWSATLPHVVTSGPVTVTWTGELVLQSQASISLQDALGSASLSISAFRLAPSAADIFAS